MITRRRRTQTVVLADTDDDQGTMWRAVRLDGKGTLTIVGHDVGPGVEQFFGCREYEYARRLSKRETMQLRQLLGVGRRGDLLAAIKQRFPESLQLESFVQAHGLVGTFWNRVGD